MIYIMFENKGNSQHAETSLSIFIQVSLPVSIQ